MGKKVLFLLATVTLVALLIPACSTMTAQAPSTATAPAPAPNTIVTVAGSPVPLGDGGPATAAQFNLPLGVALDSRNLYIADTANNRVRRVDLTMGTITTFAGTGVAGSTGDGGPATAAQLTGPRRVSVDSGNLYIAEDNRVRRVDLATGTITTLAGTGAAGFSGDGGPATAAQLNSPMGIALESRNIYIADSGNNRVRRVELTTGIITTFAGTGAGGFSGDGGAATAAQLNNPHDFALGSGNLYIADYGNNRVRKVDLATGTITTIAGGGTLSAGSGGDGGPAMAALLNGPRSVALASGNLYICDQNIHRVRKVDLTTGTITTFAGTAGGFGGDGGPATAAKFNSPMSAALDPGNLYLYIVDYGNSRVRKVELATGNIMTFAGGGTLPLGDAGPATKAQLSSPSGFAVDSRNLYIADRANNRVRKVEWATGTITTFAGTGAAGFGGDGGAATAAQLNSPRGLALDSRNLYIADSGNNRIRKVDLGTGTITTLAGTGVAGYGGDGGPATAGQLNTPYCVALDPGSLYLYIGDRPNNRVRRVDLATGIITTIAGTGVPGFSGDGGPAAAAQINGPGGLVVDSRNLYIDEAVGNRVRRVDLATGTITSIAGGGDLAAGDGGPATGVKLGSPLGLALYSGNLYIADYGNSRVRRVDLATGTITTFAGTGVAGFSGDGGPATAAQISSPWGIAFDPGNQYLYITDSGNNRVRRVNLK